MKQLEISPAARDFILAMDWQGMLRHRGMDSTRHIPAILWVTTADDVAKPESGLCLGPVIRAEVADGRLVVCEGMTASIAQLLPDEIWSVGIDCRVDLADDGLVLVRDNVAIASGK